MTSPHTSQPWNYNRQEYKDHDPFCEPGLISVLFLSCGKHELTKVCLDTTLIASRNYGSEIEWIFMEQGDDVENYAMFRDFPADRKVVIRQHNYGINNGINQMWAISRGEFCLILEADWWNDQQSFDFLGVAKKILTENNSVGIVQCRAVNDPNENWGYGKPEFLPWSCPERAEAEGFRVFEEKTMDGYQFLLSEFPNGFNNNPNLMRKSLYRECGPYPEPPMDADPRHGETEYQSKVKKTGCAIAHIGKEVYLHVGGTVRPIYERMIGVER